MSGSDALVNKSNGFTLYPTTSARSGHIAVCFDKYLIVWGGYHDDAPPPYFDWYLPPNEIWIYDTELKVWYCHQIQRGYPSGTSGATACLQDHNLYVFGGHGQFGNYNHLYKLDLKTLEWEPLCMGDEGQFPSPRDKSSSWIYQNKFYCFGGFGIPVHDFLSDHGTFVVDSTTSPMRGWNNQIVVFNLETQTWSNPRCFGDIPSPRAAHAVARIHNKVYMFGGRHLQKRLNDLHCLDLDTLTWSGRINAIGNVPEGRSWHTFTSVSESQIFLYGGFSSHCTPLSDAWLFDVKLMQWTSLEHFPNNQPRLWHAAALVQNQDVVIFGGCSNNILDDESAVEHCSDLLVFQLQPHSLVRICVEGVYKYRKQTENDWNCLPKHLLNNLKRRAEAEGTLEMLAADRDASKIVGNGENSTFRTCCIS